MAFGEQNEVPHLPTDFNIGQIKSVGNLRDSSKNPINQVLDVTIQPLIASRKKEGGEKLYITFRESWFQPGFAREDLTAHDGERFMYDNFFGKKGSRDQGLLKQLLSKEDYGELAAAVNSGGVSASQFAEFLNSKLSSKIVGYVLKQQMEKGVETDPETGEDKKVRIRTEFKGVSGLFNGADLEGIEKSFAKARNRAEKEYEKTGEKVPASVRIFWEPGQNPFELALNALG